MRDSRLNALHSYLEKQRIRQQKKSEGIILESESDEDNPFAMYKHKDEVIDLNNSVNVHGDCDMVTTKKELSCSDDQGDPELIHPEEINDQNSGTTEYNCSSKASSESESLTSKNDDHVMQAVKGYKVKMSRKKKLNVMKH